MNTAVAHRHAVDSQEKMLIDNHGRRINYVRLAVTDVCNLRCVYCMPEHMKFLPRNETLTFSENIRLLKLLSQMGITKVRITGGEPFVRPDLPDLLREIRQIPGIRNVHITTNGVLTAPHLPLLKSLGIAGINLSLDSLDRERFRQITRRDAFAKVMDTFHGTIAANIPLRVNMVVMDGVNTTDILPMAKLSQKYPVSVRFIEEMPFDGSGKIKPEIEWDHRKILTLLQSEFPEIHPLPGEAAATAQHFKIPGFAGNVGIIAGFTRTFCGSCNRIRINARGGLQTCLYGADDLNVRDLLRSSASDLEIQQAFRRRIGNRFKDGWEAQQHRQKSGETNESMSLIGG